jgi:hypothetical protein
MTADEFEQLITTDTRIAETAAIPIARGKKPQRLADPSVAVRLRPDRHRLERVARPLRARDA